MPRHLRVGLGGIAVELQKKLDVVHDVVACGLVQRCIAKLCTIKVYIGSVLYKEKAAEGGKEYRGGRR